MRIVRIADLSEEERKKALEEQEKRYQENEANRKAELKRVADLNTELRIQEKMDKVFNSAPIAENGYTSNKQENKNIWNDLKGVASNFTRSLGNLGINAYENVNRINGEYINQRNKLLEDTNNKYLTKSLGSKGYTEQQTQEIMNNTPTLESIANNSKVLNSITNNANKIIQPMENKFQEWENANNQKIQENIENASNPVSKKILELTPSIAQSSVNLIPGGNVLFSAGITQNYYEDAKQQKGMSDEEASKYASIMATLESATEMIGAGLTKNVGKALIKGNVKSALVNYGLDIGENFLEEAVMEPLNELTTTAVAGKEKANWENIGQRSLQAGIDGAITSVLMGGASAGVGSAVNVVNKISNGQTVTQNEIQTAVKDTQNSGKVDVENIVKNELNNVSNLQQNQVNNTNNLSIQQTIQEQNQLAKNSISEQTDSILNNKELPMQSYQYEKSDNVKINNLRQDANKYFNNSEKARNYVNMLEKIITDKNIDIRLDANLKTADGRIANGSYSNGVITINPNSTRAGEFIAIHELTHAIGTKEMINMINTYRQSNTEFDTAVKGLLQNYEGTEITEEALADVAGQLFGNQEFINNIAQNNPNIFQKLYSEIKYLWHQFRGYKNQNQFVEDLYYKWTQAYNSNKKSNGTSKYSIAGINAVNNIQNNSDLYNQAINKYNQANDMANQGIDNEIIRQNTGWFQDKNGDWKFGFSDKHMSLKDIKYEIGKEYKLGNILNHNELFMFYPKLAEYNVEFVEEKNSNKKAKYDDETKTISINSQLLNKKNAQQLIEGTLIHEIQHAIQHMEGFETGKSSFSKLAYYNSLGEIEADNTKTRFIDEKYNKKNISNIAPESSKSNPKHRNLDKYLQNKTTLDKIKDGIYNYFKSDKGEYDYEINQETISQDKEENNSKMDVGRHINEQENSNESSFSMQDNQGRTLTKEQQEYFKDSKVRDEKGNLLTMYHGTPNGSHNVFKNGGYFTSRKEYADGYQNTWASAISTKQDNSNPRTYEVYLNIKNPFTLSNPKAKDIYINEYIKGGNSLYYDPYTDWTNDINNLDEIDWTEGEDLKEWIQENHPEYDGLVLDEGGDGGYGEAEYSWRGKSYVPFNSNQIKNVDNSKPTNNPDIRYSISEDTESGIQALEKYEKNKKQVYKKMADEFGGGANFWEANLDGQDRDYAIRMLKRQDNVKNKFIKNNKFEKVYKPVEYSRFKTQEMQDFIKNNNIASFKDLVNDEKLVNEYFDLWFGKKETLNDYTKQAYESWKDLFDSQKEIYSRNGETIRTLKSFERDISNINNGVTEIVDEYETGKKLENMPEFNKYVEEFVNPLYNTKPQLSTEELTELAQDTFGTTTDFKVGAYMTPDGKLLNFRDGKSEYRNDHRGIASIGYNMQEFIDAGNIRMKPEGNGFELTLEPTSEQYDTLSDYIDNLNGEVYVEIDIGNNKYDGANYKAGTSTSKIISDLQYYFRNGKFPAKSEFADFRYSQNNQTWQQYLDKNFKPTGTRTSMQDILPTAKAQNNTQNVAPTAENNVLPKAKNIENNKGLNDITHIEKPKTMELPSSEEKAKENKIAKVLLEPVKNQKSKQRTWAILQANLIDKGAVFETLSLKTDNRELQAKYDATLSSGAKGQYAIGNDRYTFENGKKTLQAKSLTSIIDEVGNKVEDFSNYMYHQLNIDRMTLEERFGGDTGINYERKESVKNKPVFGEDITAEYSKQKVEEYENKYPEFKKYAKDIYDYLDANKAELVKNGVISQELSDKFKEMYPHYVPIARINTNNNNIAVPLDTYRTGINNPIKRAKGGSSDIQPLFNTIADRTLQTYRASARNAFGVELKNTLEKNNLLNAINENTDIDTIIDTMADEQQTGLTEGTKYKNPTFTVFENGEKVTYDINLDMYDALKPQNELITKINDSKLSKAVNKISNIRRGLLTEYNPLFSITNSIKDAQDVLQNSQHALKTYRKFPEAYAQIMQKGYWYNEYIQNGGEQNSYFKDGNFELNDNLPKAKKAITMPLKVISKMNNVIEMAPRLAEYIASRESGKSIQTSMLDASRVTTNFKAGGDITKALNRNGATFLNAGVQGMAQQVRNIREAHAKGLKGYAVLATKTILAGMPALILNNLVWDDDEEYENLQDYVKDSYYIVGKIGDNQFIRIPKGRTTAVIQKLFTTADKYITDGKEINIDNFAEDFWTNLLFAKDNIAPNNPIDNNILAPMVQAVSNKTWYGEDLVPSRLQNVPKAEQYDETTDIFSKWVGEKLNISPIKINYVLDQYGGGLSDVLLPLSTPQAENNPIEDKFTTNSVMKSKYPGEFFEKIDELEINSNSSKATDEDKLKYKYISDISKETSDLYKKKREIQNSTLTDKEKKEQLIEVQKQINSLAKEALEKVDTIKVNGNTATINKNKYYKTTDVKDNTKIWKKLSDEEVEKNKNISLSTYADYKEKVAQETIKQRKSGNIKEDGSIKDKDKMSILINSNYSNKEKQAIYENYIKDANDKKYNIVKTTGIDINKYLEYKSKGLTTKDARYNYIENMQGTTYMQKIILFGLENAPSYYDKKTIVNYINTLPGKTQSEKQEMLKSFSWYK